MVFKKDCIKIKNSKYTQHTQLTINKDVKSM